MKKESSLLNKLQILKISLICSWISYGIMVLLGIAEDSGTIAGGIVTGAVILLWVIIFIMGILYVVSLGMLAESMNRSVIVWVGLPIITAPIGPIIAFLMMRNLINAEMQNNPGEV